MNEQTNSLMHKKRVSELKEFWWWLWGIPGVEGGLQTPQVAEPKSNQLWCLGKLVYYKCSCLSLFSINQSHPPLTNPFTTVTSVELKDTKSFLQPPYFR